MNEYTIFDARTGAIIGGGCTDTEGFPLGEFESLYVGEALSAKTHWFDGDTPVVYTQVEREALAARPPHAARWDVGVKAWIDTRDLEQVRADKWTEIKAARECAEYGGFTWDGSAFDSGAISQARIQASVQLANIVGAAFSIDWTLADNTVRTLSAPDMLAVGIALGQHVQAQFGKARALRFQIEAAALAATLEALAW
jgi:hypothetical protein